MYTFRTLDAQIGMVPGPMTVALRAIDQSQGSERAFSLQHPEALKTLIQIARIQSVESSNAIEDVTAPHARVVELVEEKTTPANRSEAEIAGYRSVLAVQAAVEKASSVCAGDAITPDVVYKESLTANP